jgi:hypothetical protein
VQISHKKHYSWKIISMRCIKIIIVLAIAGLAVVGFLRKARTTINQGFPMMIDLACYYVTAHTLNAGLSPYDKDSMDSIAYSLEINDYTDYIYPPFWGTIFRPLAFLSKSQMVTVWFIVNIFLYFSSIFILNSTFKIKRPYRYLLFLTFLFPPIYDTILVGNINIFLLLFFAIILYFSINEHIKYSKVITAIFIGICIGIKLYPAALLIPYIFHRRYLIVIYSLLTTLMTVLIGILFRGSLDITNQWITSVVSSIPTKMVTYGDVSIYAVVYRLFNKGDYQAYDGNTLFDIRLDPIFNISNIHIPLAVLLALAIFIVTLSYIYKIHIQHTESTFTASFSIIICMILLITPKVWDHYYTLIIIPLMFIATKFKLSYLSSLVFLSIILLILLQRFIAKILLLFPNHIMTFLPFFAGLLTWLLIVVMIDSQKKLTDQTT